MCFPAAPRISNITETGCLVEWSPLKHIPGQGDLYYRVSLTKVRENEAKIVSVVFDHELVRVVIRFTIKLFCRPLVFMVKSKRFEN